MSRLLFSAIAGLLLVPPVASSSVQLTRHSNINNNKNNNNNDNNNNNNNESRVLWSLQTPNGSSVHASPVAAASSLFYSTLEPDCGLYAADPATGKTLWRFAPPQRDTLDPTHSRCGLRTTVRVGSVNQSSVGFSNNNNNNKGSVGAIGNSSVEAAASSPGERSVGVLLHGGDDNNTFFAVDAATGDLVWADSAPSQLCPDGPNLRVCEVYSLALLVDSPSQTETETETETETLSQTKREPRDSTQQVRIQGSEDGHVRAWEATTGRLLWDRVVGGRDSAGNLVPANGSPVLNPSNHSQFIIGVDDGFLHFLDVATGNQSADSRNVATCGSMDTLPSVDEENRVLYFTCFHDDPTNPATHVAGWVGAVDTDSQTYLWKHNDSTGVPLFVAAENAVFVGYDNGTVAALSPSNGSIIWVNNGIATGKEFFGTCAYDAQRRRLYCASLAKKVLALDAQSGQVVWTEPTQGILAEVVGPAISEDQQKLFVGDYDGNLFALRLDD